METSIETINGKLYTVIRKPFDADWVREQLAMGVPVLAELKPSRNGYVKRGALVYAGNNSFGIADWYDDEGGALYVDHSYQYTLTILPALPRYPKIKDVDLLFRYASEGLRACIRNEAGNYLHMAGYEPEVNAAYLPFSGHSQQGGMVWFETSDFEDDHGVQPEITHAINSDTGERIDVAISDEETGELDMPDEAGQGASSADLFKELGATTEEAEKSERELNAILRRSTIKDVKNDMEL